MSAERESLKSSQAEVRELQSKRDELRDRVSAAQAELEAMKQARMLEEKLAERDRLERTVREKGIWSAGASLALTKHSCRSRAAVDRAPGEGRHAALLVPCPAH